MADPGGPATPPAPPTGGAGGKTWSIWTEKEKLGALKELISRVKDGKLSHGAIMNSWGQRQPGRSIMEIIPINACRFPKSKSVEVYGAQKFP